MSISWWIAYYLPSHVCHYISLSKKLPFSWILRIVLKTSVIPSAFQSLILIIGVWLIYQVLPLICLLSIILIIILLIKPHEYSPISRKNVPVCSPTSILIMSFYLHLCVVLALFGNLSWCLDCSMLSSLLETKSIQISWLVYQIKDSISFTKVFLLRHRIRIYRVKLLFDWLIVTVAAVLAEAFIFARNA